MKRYRRQLKEDCDCPECRSLKREFYAFLLRSAGERFGSLIQALRGRRRRRRLAIAEEG